MKPSNLSKALLMQTKGLYKPVRALLTPLPSITVLNHSQDRLNYASVDKTAVECVKQMCDDKWHFRSQSLPVQQSDKIHDDDYCNTHLNADRSPCAPSASILPSLLETPSFRAAAFESRYRGQKFSRCLDSTSYVS